MQINLREVLEIPGRSFDFDYKISPDETSYIKGAVFGHPISVKGTFRNRSGIVMLKYSTSYTIDLCCDRCLTLFSKDVENDFSHEIRYGSDYSGEDADVLTIDEDTICLNDIVLSDILLQLPSKILCKEDCKGLCPVCGRNLNDGQCDCQKNNVQNMTNNIFSSVLKGGATNGSTKE